MRHVKGVLFADYVRMIRGNKHVEWPLSPEDRAYVDARVAPDGWYPMEVFERLGNTILLQLAGGNVDAVRMWGRFSVDQLSAAQPMLVAAGDPVETLNRFRVLRASYFDFDALEVIAISDGEAQIEVRYHMGPTAEEAASHQTLGFFERLLEVAGAVDMFAQFGSRSWAGDPRTLIQLVWLRPDDTPRRVAVRREVVARIKR